MAFKAKYKIVINNKMRGAYGRTTITNGKADKIEVNVKKHYTKGILDRANLASTIKHELLHAKHPKMTEAEVYKKSRKTKLSQSEIKKYVAKIHKTRLA